MHRTNVTATPEDNLTAGQPQNDCR